MNIINKFLAIVKKYKWSIKEKKLFKIFKKQNNYRVRKKQLILIQCVEDPYYYALFGQIITDVREKKSICVDQYILRNFSVGSYKNFIKYIKSKVLNNRFMDKKWTNLYGSYCDEVAYSNEEGVGFIVNIKLFFQAKSIASQLMSKEELIALKINNIIIGDLVYDTYLRFKPAPTVDMKDFYLIIVIWKALRNIKITKKYFDRKKPEILLQSYSSYIQHGICARVALQYGTDVYTFGHYQKMEKKLRSKDYLHTALTSRYKNDFEGFMGKKEKLIEADRALIDRLNGKIDISTSYMKESAYLVSETDIPKVEGAVIVFLHDFFDSPHCYRSMVFPDFLEWLEFTILQLDRYEIPYFLKPHPNQIADSNKVVKKISKKYPHLRILSAQITNKQLVDAGIKAGITVYGTIAHELAYMGVPLITCGDNPHSSYNFCFEAKTKEQYSDFLKNIENLTYTNIEKVKYEAKSFYYMHNLNLFSDEKELNKHLSLFRQMNANLNDQSDFNLYQKQLDQIKHNEAYIGFIEKL